MRRGKKKDRKKKKREKKKDATTPSLTSVMRLDGFFDARWGLSELVDWFK